MENRFAGAQHQHERRRRWIATDNVSDCAEPTLMPLYVGTDSAADEAPGQQRQFTGAGTLLTRAISARLWKHLVVLLTLGLTGIMTIWLESRLQSMHGRGESVINGFVGLTLFVSAQLALLIGWVRSLSDLDFQGRYRSWRWLAVGCLLLSATLLTDTSGLVPELLGLVIEPVAGPVEAARPALVLVLTSAFCLAVFARIIPDMSRCRSSQMLLVSGLLLMIIRFMLTTSVGSEAVGVLTLSSLLVAASWCVFSSMLLHCRFVAYVSNDPPMRKNSQIVDPATQQSESLKTSDEMPEAVATSSPTHPVTKNAVAQKTQVQDERNHDEVQDSQKQEGLTDEPQAAARKVTVEKQRSRKRRKKRKAA